MTVDPFLRPVSGYDFGTPTDRGPHPGVDYDLRYEEIGLPFAVTIEQEGQIDQGVGGNEVLAKITGTPYELILAHLDRFRRQAGDVVPAGADIAESGATGEASGPHLHLQVIDDRLPGTTWAERSVDPRSILQEVKAMQSVGGGDPSSGPANSSTLPGDQSCQPGFHLQEIDIGPVRYNRCVPDVSLPDAIGGVASSAASGAVDRLVKDAPGALVTVALIATIGILAFGGVKRIAD